MKVTLIHPGTQYSHRLVCQLDRVDVLDKFITGIAFASSNGLAKKLSKTVLPQISNRIIHCSVPSHKLVVLPWDELVALCRLKIGGDHETIMYDRNRKFQERIPVHFFKTADAIIGFDTSSWLSSIRAQQFGKPYFLDQSIGHPVEKVKIFSMLQLRYPEWIEDIPQKSSLLMTIEHQEYESASKIIVASSFTKNSLLKNGVNENKIIVNPYGVSGSFFINRSSKRRTKIRFLYLGFLGARKGLPLLLDVWKNNEFHEKSELWLAGPSSSFALKAIQRVPGIKYLGALPHTQLPHVLEECDCLVFPSYFEGFGQVILEAMAAGLPVITTEATAGPDIIKQGVDGFLFETGDENRLAELMRIFILDNFLAENMGKAARNKARTFSWDAYGDRWKSILENI